VVSDTTITADSPAGTGVVNVTVVTPAGTSAVTPADEFTYTVAVAPVVTAVSPNSGSTAGGTLVTITGTSFTGATAVNFGTTPATNVTVVNDTTITANSPAGTGTVDVTVTTPVGTSAASPADQFTFTVAVAPTVTGLSPTSGPATGGTLVTITGTSFTGATAVHFGTTAATNVMVVSDTTITADSPAGSGTVGVTVTTPRGTSAVSSASMFTFTGAAAPTVVSLARFGFHMQPTSLVLTFSAALDPTRAQNVNNYQLMDSAGNVIPVSSAVYNASALTVTLFPTQLLSLQQAYQLTVIGMPPNGLTSASGVPIDGAGNGTPGTNFVETFSGEILAGPAPQMLRTNAARFAAELKQLAALEKQWKAHPHSSAAARRRLAAAEKRMAALARRLAAQVTGDSRPSASAVDQLLSFDPVSVKQLLAMARSGGRDSLASIAQERWAWQLSHG
jgi:hypothetical protein